MREYEKAGAVISDDLSQADAIVGINMFIMYCVITWLHMCIFTYMYMYINAVKRPMSATMYMYIILYVCGCIPYLQIYIRCLHVCLCVLGFRIRVIERGKRIIELCVFACI